MDLNLPLFERIRADHLPNLHDGEFEVTSPVDGVYNCLAFAADDLDNWWWPMRHPGYYWPPELRLYQVGEDVPVSACIDAYRTIGYDLTRVQEHHIDFDRVAIYGVGSRLTHAARMAPDGSGWMSKLGRSQDIVHHRLDGVSCDDYGEPVVLMERRVGSMQPA